MKTNREVCTLRWIGATLLGLALCLSAGTAWAQAENGTETPAERATRQVDRTIERMTRELGLSEDQAQKIRAILTETVTAREEADGAERSRVEQILAPDQVDRYRQMNRRGRGGRGGEGGGWGGPGGGGQAMMDAMIERLRTDLSITPEQETKINEALAAVRDEMTKLMTAMREGGFENQDWQSVRQKMTELWDGASAKIRENLDATQQEKFDSMVKEMRDRNPFFRGGPEGRGQRGEGPGGRGGQSIEERVAGAMAKLDVADLEPDQIAAMKSLVEEIEKARMDRTQQEEAQRALEESLAQKADLETIQAKVAALREARTKRDEAIKDKREQLRSVLTEEEEAELIAMGVLD